MTETIVERPTAGALQSRIAEVLTFPETMIRTRPAPFREGSMHNIYVIESPEEGPQSNVGTIMELEPAPSGNGWLNRRVGAGSFHRYYGALVNPEPVNGRYYRSLAPDQFLVRYNDDEHAADRHNEALPWSLIRGTGDAAWVVPNDGLGSLNLFPYVEVEFEETTPDVPAAEETAVRTAETEEAEPAEPAVPSIGNEVSGPTRGMAHVEEDGTILLDPPMVQGEAYLMWPSDEEYSGEWGTTYLAAYAGGELTAAPSFISYGYFDWNRGRDEVRWTNDYYFQTTITDRHWVKAALIQPDAEVSNDAVTDMESKRATELAQFEEFNRRANGIAKTAGWCEEYDRIVTSVGMKGRYKRYRFDLAVTFTFEDYSPSSQTDNRVRELHDLDSSLSLSNITYSATMDLSIEVENQPDRESAEGWIDSSEIENAIGRMATGLSGIDVTDWNVEDWENLDGDEDDDDEDED